MCYQNKNIIKIKYFSLSIKTNEIKEEENELENKIIELYNEMNK